MKKDRERLTSLAESLKSQHRDSNVYNFLSFIYTADIVNKYMETEFRTTGLDRTKLGVLHFLLANGGTMTPTELSNSTLRSKDTITKAIDNLDKLGLTKSTKSRSDRRLRKVSITAKGLDLMEKFLPLRQQIFSRAMACLDPGDAGALRAMLKQFREHVLGLIETGGVTAQKRPDQISSLLKILRSDQS